MIIICVSDFAWKKDIRIRRSYPICVLETKRLLVNQRKGLNNPTAHQLVSNNFCKKKFATIKNTFRHAQKSCLGCNLGIKHLTNSLQVQFLLNSFFSKLI